MAVAGVARQQIGADRLGHVIKRAEQALIARKTRALRAFDLTVPQYAALLLLSDSSGMSAAQLARGCLVTPQTMMTVLSNLESKGFVHREPSAVHQKVLVTTLTRSGRAVLRKADKAALGVEAEMAAQFTAAELDSLRSMLETAISSLNSDQA